MEHVQCAWNIDKSFYTPLPRPELSRIVIHILKGNGWVTTVWISHAVVFSSTAHRRNTMKRPQIRAPPLKAVITRQVHQKVVLYCHLTHARLTRSVNDNNHSPVGTACHLQHTNTHTHTHICNQPPPCRNNNSPNPPVPATPPRGPSTTGSTRKLPTIHVQIFTIPNCLTALALSQWYLLCLMVWISTKIILLFNLYIKQWRGAVNEILICLRCDNNGISYTLRISFKSQWMREISSGFEVL
jgi:hypothetical protein